MKLISTNIFIFALGIAMADDLTASFESSEIIPDVFTTAPKELLSVKFQDVAVQFNKELTPTQVKDVPKLQWTSESSSFYTVGMLDSDAPSRKEPKFRSFIHWLVVNVPGNDVSKGDVLANYIGSGPANDTDLHRYVLFVYKQPGKIDITGGKHFGNSARERRRFSIRRFSRKYGLGTPLAANMYTAQYDNYVPNIHKQLSGE